MDPLASRCVGRTEVKVSQLGLGGAPLGDFYELLPEAQALATIGEAREAELNLFDTSPLYGHGLSEHRFGTVLRQSRREDFVLSTKVGRYLVPMTERDIDRGWFKGGLNFQPVTDYGYDATMRAVEQSYHRLGLNRIDILLIHDVDVWTHGSLENYARRFDEAMEGAYRALSELRRDGTVRAIGVGVNEVEPCLRFAGAGDFDCFMLAGRYTLLEQGALDALLPLALDKGISLLIAGPFNSGILASGTAGTAKYNYKDAPAHVLDKVRGIETVCKRHGVALAAAALQFPLAHSAVASIVSGAVKPEEVRHNITLMSQPIPSVFWEDLREQSLIRDDAPTP